MIPIITIRPEAGARASVARARAEGVKLLAFPMFTIEPVAWTGPERADIDALLLGSASALALAGAGLRRYAGMPVYAVGPSTAAAAQRAGLAIAREGSGGLQQVIDAIDDVPIRLLRLAGRRHVPLDLPEGVSVATRVVYEARPEAMPSELVEMLRGGAVVMLHSAAAAEHFAAECDRLALDRTRIRIAAFGPRIAEAAGKGWGALRAVDQPEGGALLALARDMCH